MHRQGLEQSFRWAHRLNVAVIGAGTMGAGITYSCLGAGFRVTVLDNDDSGLARGLKTIESYYEVGVARGRVSPAAARDGLSRLETSQDYDALADADLVIEAVFEKMDIKREVFARLDRVCRPDAVLAINTSTLDVDRIAAATNRPDKVIGLHFFSPAHIMRLLEIVRGAATWPAWTWVTWRAVNAPTSRTIPRFYRIADELVKAGRLGKKTGKGMYLYESGSRKPQPDPEVQALISREASALGIEQRQIDPREIVERCIYALVVEGARILEEGIASRAGDIDVIWANGYGFGRHRGGPMHYADEIGVDKVYAAVKEFRDRFGPMYWEIPSLLEDLGKRGGKFADL